MTALNLSLHPAQLEVFQSTKRFKVVVAGRRTGKSYYAGVELITKALQGVMDVTYIAPTFGQAKDIMWDTLHAMAGELITGSHTNDGWIRLLNGRKIHVKGADRPDTMRGTARSHFVLDEFGDMKVSVWEEIVRPQLADVKGSATFIGTPKGRNHFYRIAMQARDGFENPDTGEKEHHPDWGYWHFTTHDNPFIDKAEIETARQTLSSFAFRQEYLASFEAAASDLFRPEWFRTVSGEEPRDGQWYIAVDLAGFGETAKNKKSKLVSLDESAIAMVKVLPNGKWWVKDIQAGRWGIRETAIRIIKAYRDVRPVALGIEKGALMNAILPILREEMVRYGIHFTPRPLTHGNKAKIDRVVWALQGRLEKGRIEFHEDCSKNTDILDQLMQFPDAKSHDDLIDALAYIAQLAVAGAGMMEVYDSHEVMDAQTGY